jgi:hypothetical protein
LAEEDLPELLAADVLALRQRVEAQHRRLEDLEGVLSEMAELLETTRPDVTLSPWWWPAMRRGEAEAAWEILTSWVDDVLIGRYDNNPHRSAGSLAEGSSIKLCWFAHPDVVDKLSALHWTWRRSYSRSATTAGPIDWQSSLVPRTLGQIKSQLTNCMCAGGCSALGEGHNRPKAGQLTLEDRALFIDRDLTTREVADPS